MKATFSTAVLILSGNDLPSSKHRSFTRDISACGNTLLYSCMQLNSTNESELREDNSKTDRPPINHNLIPPDIAQPLGLMFHKFVLAL